MIQDFISAVREHGVARTNRFKVDIVLPSALAEDVQAERTLSLLCIQASLPGISLTLSENETSGTPSKAVISEGNDDIDLVFLCTENMGEKSIFDKWMNFIADPYSHRVAYYDDYVTDIVVATTNRQDAVTYSVKLVNAFPVAITPVQLDRTEQDGFLRLQVTFTAKKVVVL